MKCTIEQTQIDYGRTKSSFSVLKNLDLIVLRYAPYSENESDEEQSRCSKDSDNNDKAVKDISGAEVGNGLKDVGADKRVEYEAVAVEYVSGAKDGNGLKDVGDDERVEDEAAAVEISVMSKMDIG